MVESGAFFQWTTSHSSMQWCPISVHALLCLTLYRQLFGHSHHCMNSKRILSLKEEANCGRGLKELQSSLNPSSASSVVGLPQCTTPEADIFPACILYNTVMADSTASTPESQVPCYLSGVWHCGAWHHGASPSYCRLPKCRMAARSFEISQFSVSVNMSTFMAERMLAYS